MFSTHSFKLYSLRYRARGNNCFGAQTFNKRTLDALKFDQRKDSPKMQHSKRQFLSQYTIFKINNTSRLLTYRWICNRSCCFACEFRRLNDNDSLFQSTETAQCSPFNLFIHRMENKRTDNRNLFSHNWKNFLKKFKHHATNFLAHFQRFEDALNKHVTLKKRARVTF